MKWNFEKLNKPLIINIPEITSPLNFSESENESENEKCARIE
jgi:hypothetical protein